MSDVDKPHIRLKAYVESPGNKRWVTYWRKGARRLNIIWMEQAMDFARERNRTEQRGVHAVR